MTKRKIKVLDSFSGAGGFSLGFELTGDYEIIGGIEYDQWAADTFKHNHKGANVLVGDIQQYSDEDLLRAFQEKPDIILGGPPCQGYSICNRNAGDPKDPRNSLFQEFVRLGRIFNPEVMIMENVPNITKAKTADKEFVIDIIKKELEELGYFTYDKILSATDYGVPQIRKRLVVIATKTPLENPHPSPTHSVSDTAPSLFGEGLKKCPTLWDAISDLPDIEAREGSEEMPYDKTPTNDYQVLLRKGSEKVYNNKAMNHSKRMVERFESMSWGHSVSDVPDHLKPHKRNGNGEISTKVYDQNNRRLYPEKPCHTIAASFYANFVHPFKNRNFTPREGARVQSFPDWFVFKGKPTVVSHKLLAREGRTEEKHLCQYNQIGNAVPPLMAKAIAENIYQVFKSEPIKELECTFTETI
ncbi:DNA (cytosine-5)-methyltransferase 1 [Reichenbachiella agariperforans]|uniref:Cytosine-specific methyltransferase n=1 Tax=Reichenbachiella agariperforans TaxID=156994 RepID=A0A1M6VCX0_REIAG|nr:DNA cytosine methyltransferase [Reichenbachiella agariperforans]SHK79320.1 DNA (cytosine-5)-methyltransferase 1 [Reichenbachiella agariperforans]